MMPRIVQSVLLGVLCRPALHAAAFPSAMRA
jgi:hypothetical protein